MRALVFWSSGKDSALALLRLRALGLEVAGLVTTVDSTSKVVTGHRVPVELVRQQAERLGVPLYEIELPEDFPPTEVYEEAILRELPRIKRESGARVAAHGDVHERSMMEYKRMLLRRVGIESLYPLDGLSSADVVSAVLAEGIRALVVTADVVKLGLELARELVCTTLDWRVLGKLPAAADVAGEGGEYHTFVYYMPGFREPVGVMARGVRLESWRLGRKLVCVVEPAV